ncbi:MAG: hypothetical protein KAV87_64760, partial [Desulfobacteraceae bacterium]|nr:hypothetical protein [Desulfobacteraceae bacterium]
NSYGAIIEPISIPVNTSAKSVNEKCVLVLSHLCFQDANLIGNQFRSHDAGYCFKLLLWA